jgi:hypothetical protein
MYQLKAINNQHQRWQRNNGSNNESENGGEIMVINNQ